jgi:hypothetical protein
MKNYFDIYICDDSKWKHSIYESIDEYCQDCGKDLDSNGMVDDHDYEMYLNAQVSKLDNHGVEYVR